MTPKHVQAARRSPSSRTNSGDRRSAATRDLIGAAIEIDGVRRTVVGIMPPAFDVADQRTQIWLPLVIDRGDGESRRPLPVSDRPAGRRRHAIGNARAELDTLLATWQTAAARHARRQRHSSCSRHDKPSPPNRSASRPRRRHGDDGRLGAAGRRRCSCC